MHTFGNILTHELKKLNGERCRCVLSCHKYGRGGRKHLRQGALSVYARKSCKVTLSRKPRAYFEGPSPWDIRHSLKGLRDHSYEEADELDGDNDEVAAAGTEFVEGAVLDTDFFREKRSVSAYKKKRPHLGAAACASKMRDMWTDDDKPSKQAGSRKGGWGKR